MKYSPDYIMSSVLFIQSVAVDVADRFKQAYWRLADLMFQEVSLSSCSQFVTQFKAL